MSAAGRLVLVVTSPRVAPGLLCWPAWEALRRADRVLASAGSPQLPHVEAAGVAVEVVSAASSRELAGLLLDAAAAGEVVHLGGADGDPGLARELSGALPALAEAGQAPEVEVLPGSYDLPGGRLLDLVAVMDRLRSPGGCPWDARQTHASLVTYLLEEAYETVETIEAGDLLGLREELGDLLLQVVFHARIGEEHAEAPWSVDDVAAGIVEKLVRRHPHVFGAAAASAGGPAGGLTAERVEANWDAIKAAEKGRTSAVDGVPLAQPALSLAAKLLSRAERAGLDLPVAPVDLGRSPDEDAGDVLLAVVAAARDRGVDPEGALRAAARRYADRIRAAEAASAAPPASAAPER